MINSYVRVRFAPSPTGHLHIGGVRTALYNYLFARHHKGKFFLRIEDTDRVRSTEESISVIFENLKWLGLDWDEEPCYQSKRLNIYDQYFERLLSKDKAYEVQGGAITFRVKKMDISFNDAIHGKISFDSSLIEDFIIRKADGFPTYNFACVVDDIEMGITHVIRGDDHISNTPRQILIYKTFETQHPVFSHIPMILGEDGARLSKRHGATSVSEYRERGYLPEALLNFLALLGWSPGNDQEFLTRDEMIEKFTIDRVNKTSARFDNTKLDWMNGQYIKNMPTQDLLTGLRPFLGKIGINPDNLGREWICKLIELYRERFKTLQEFIEQTYFFFLNDIKYDNDAVKKFLQKDNHSDGKHIYERLKNCCEALSLLDNFEVQTLENCLRSLCERYNMGFARLAQPIRVAITGRSVSASIFETMELLGKDKTINRIKYAIDMYCKK